MKRKNLVRYFVLGVFGLAIAAGLTARGKAHQPRPNIILIIVDALRADHLPVYGYHKNTAPFLKELARDAVVFERASSVAPLTAPSMASVFTSTYSFQHHVVSNSYDEDQSDDEEALKKINKLPSGLLTLAEFLKNQGYRTYALSDNANICCEMGFAAGFDRFKMMAYEGAESVVDQLTAWSEEIRGREPYFLYVHFMDPHTRYHQRQPWFQEKRNPYAERVAAYDSEISYVDARLRELFYAFDWQDDDLIIFAADHGEEFKEHGHWGHGKNLYKEALHVPLMFSYPARIHPGRRHAFVSTLDIFPTVCDIIGRPFPPQIAGHSLLPSLMDSDESSPRRPIYAYTRSFKDPFIPVAAVVHDGWKLILDNDTASLLYDLNHDSRERRDVKNDFPALVSAMEKLLQTYRAQCKEYKEEYGLIHPRGDAVKHMRALGYLQ